MTEIAYLKSGFVRVIQTDESRFEVQTMKLRGEAKAHGTGIATWTKLYGVYDREKAIRLLESYA